MDNYFLCGLRVASEVELPELAPWMGDQRPVDVTIRLGQVPDPAPGANWLLDYLQVNPDGGVRLAVADAATFLISGGRDILVTPRPDATDKAIRIYLLGTGLTVICHQRGLFPLHGSAVRWGCGAVAFVGPSGAGKSTTAAILRDRGYNVLADDVCAVDLSGAKPMVVPAFPRLKLWGAALDLASIEGGHDVAQRESDGKYHFMFTGGGEFSPAPLPLSAICMLETAEPGAPARAELIEDRTARLAAISTHVHRRHIANALGLRAFLFKAAAQVATVTPVLKLVRCAEPERIEETLAVLIPALNRIAGVTELTGIRQS